MDPRDENAQTIDESPLRGWGHKPPRRLPLEHVARERERLARLSREDLVTVYELLIRRTNSRTVLSSATLIDLVIWIEAYPQLAGSHRPRR